MNTPSAGTHVGRLRRHYTRPGRAELGAAGGLVVYGLAQLEADAIDGDEALHVLDQMCGADASTKRNGPPVSGEKPRPNTTPMPPRRDLSNAVHLDLRPRQSQS